MARIIPPLRFSSFGSIMFVLLIQKFDIEIMIIILEINGAIEGMKNSFLAFRDPNARPINPDRKIIGDIIFNCEDAISFISIVKLGPTIFINKSDERKINKLIINNVRDKILLIEFINNLLSTLFLSANKVTIELCNGPLIPPKRTKKNPGII